MHSHLATFVFQAINFLVLAGVLRRWLYQPVQAVIARRQKEIEAPLAAADTDRAAAAELRAVTERERAAVAGERDGILAEAERQAELRRDALLAEARRQSDETAGAGRHEIEQERQAIESKVRERTADLAVAIARRLLGASGCEIATGTMLDQAMQAVETLDDSGREKLRRESGAHPSVRVVTATTLDERARSACAARLHRALGEEATVEFAADRDLLAGAEIHLPATVVRQSWREHLDRARRELLL